MAAARTTDDGLTIDQMAKATGISPGVLRMWEIRYGWPTPARKPNGYRLYQRSLVPLVMRLAALIYGTKDEPARYRVSDIIRDGFPSWPSSGPAAPERARTWTRFAQLPPAHVGEATTRRERLAYALRRRDRAAILRLLHEANIVLRPMERHAAAWLPAYFGAMEWILAGNPLPLDVARAIARIAGEAVLLDVAARWQTAEAIG